MFITIWACFLIPMLTIGFFAWLADEPTQEVTIEDRLP
jgi:hypothetical protein